MKPDPLIQQALRLPREGDAPPADLLPLLLARVPAPQPSRWELRAWLLAPVLGGAALLALSHFSWDVQLPAPPALLLPLLAAGALHALSGRLRPPLKD